MHSLHAEDDDDTVEMTALNETALTPGVVQSLFGKPHPHEYKSKPIRPWTEDLHLRGEMENEEMIREKIKRENYERNLLREAMQDPDEREVDRQEALLNAHLLRESALPCRLDYDCAFEKAMSSITASSAIATTSVNSASSLSNSGTNGLRGRIVSSDLFAFLLSDTSITAHSNSSLQPSA